LVYKRSIDGGKTWSSLKKLVEIDEKNASNLGYCRHNLVIGNISPVELRNDSKIHPNRIIAPYTRNNFKLWVIYSDDDGLTWHSNHEIPGVSQT
jgi:Neuraminidase (sialidase)